MAYVDDFMRRGKAEEFAMSLDTSTDKIALVLHAVDTEPRDSLRSLQDVKDLARQTVRRAVASGDTQVLLHYDLLRHERHRLTPVPVRDA